MIKLQLLGFILHWLASSIGIYFCITWFGTLSAGAATGEKAWLYFAIAGLIFSVLNAILKPIIKLIALPLALLTLGLSTLAINTGMVLLTIHLMPGVEMEVWGALVSSLVLSFANGVINFLIK